MVVERVERGVCKVRDDELTMILHDLEVGGGARCICQGCWGRFFWLVHPRRGNWGNLVIGVERPDADALVIWFVIACSGDANDANRRVVGAAGVGVVCVASAVVDGARIVAVADAVVDEYVGPFANDGVDAEVRIASGGGACVGFDGDADGVVGATVAAVVGVVVIVIAVAAPVVVAMRGWWGVGDIGGNLAEVEGMP